MAEREVLALNEDTPQIEVPQSDSSGTDTYALPRDVSLKNNDINAVKRIEISGSLTPYTSGSAEFIGILEDHTWDFGAAIMDAALRMSGTHEFPQGASLFGAGFLFHNNAEFRCSGGSLFSGIYTLASQPTYVCDGVSPSIFVMNDIVSNVAFKTENGGTMPVSSSANYLAEVAVNDSTTLTRHFGYRVNQPIRSGASFSKGTVTQFAAFASANLSPTSGDNIAPTNYAHFLAGNVTSAVTGRWCFYQVNREPNRWNGSQRYAFDEFNGAVTLDSTHHVVKCYGATAFTVTLPTAVGIAGREYIIKSWATDTITVDGAGAETIDGAATYSLPNTNDYVRIVSDGAAWMVTGSN